MPKFFHDSNRSSRNRPDFSGAILCQSPRALIPLAHFMRNRGGTAQRRTILEVENGVDAGGKLVA